MRNFKAVKGSGNTQGKVVKGSDNTQGKAVKVDDKCSLTTDPAAVLVHRVERVADVVGAAAVRGDGGGERDRGGDSSLGEALAGLSCTNAGGCRSAGWAGGTARKGRLSCPKAVSFFSKTVPFLATAARSCPEVGVS